MDASNKPLTVPHALHIASQYAITALVIGSIVFYCIMVGSWKILFGFVGDDLSKLLIQVVGTMVVALFAKYVTKTIWYYLRLVFIRGDEDDAFLEDVGVGVPEDADDDFAGQDVAPAEAPVATVTIAAPLRRSKRVAAQ
jgi:hypothetical protein